MQSQVAAHIRDAKRHHEKLVAECAQGSCEEAALHQQTNSTGAGLAEAIPSMQVLKLAISATSPERHNPPELQKPWMCFCLWNAHSPCVPLRSTLHCCAVLQHEAVRSEVGTQTDAMASPAPETPPMLDEGASAGVPLLKTLNQIKLTEHQLAILKVGPLFWTGRSRHSACL